MILQARTIDMDSMKVLHGTYAPIAEIQSIMVTCTNNPFTFEPMDA
jgi:hypothetical protein